MAEQPAQPDLASQVCQVVITAPDADWLVAFTRNLVEDRLIAAVHHAGEIRSIYRWHGEVFDRAEATAALHTRRALVSEIVRRVSREHPYEVPGVVATAIDDGNPAYLQWIIDETHAPTVVRDQP